MLTNYQTTMQADMFSRTLENHETSWFSEWQFTWVHGTLLQW